MEHENTSTLLDIESFASQIDHPVVQDDFSPENIFELLCNEIRLVSKELRNTDRQKRTCYGEEKTVMIPEMTSLLESQTHIIHQLVNHSKELITEDYPHFKKEAIMSIPLTLSQEIDSCKKTIEWLGSLKNNQKSYLKLLEQSAKICDELECTEAEPSIDEDELNIIMRKVDDDYKQCRNDMKTVLDILYEDYEILWNILEVLVSKSLSKKEEDKWYKIKDPNEMQAILVLININIVTIHPNDPLKIKLHL